MDTIISLFKKYFETDIDKIERLPQSGSDRKYYRLFWKDQSIIVTSNNNIEENNAFVGFAHHFRSLGLSVPEIYYYSPTDGIYFQQDLGDINLYSWLQNSKSVENGLDTESKVFYKKVFDQLILFQTKGIKGLNTSLCYPVTHFDHRAMLWDLNYFKYMYLKLLSTPFNESALEDDFHTLTNYLLSAGHESFLYRDFQTANIMYVEGEPYFIDFQGGRLGAPQYDPASLLYDAKIPMLQSDREELLEYYIDEYCKQTEKDQTEIRAYFYGFSLIRVMQACGAFGFRGLYEHKPSFSECLVPGGKLLQQIIPNVSKNINIPEIEKVIKNLKLDTI